MHRCEDFRNLTRVARLTLLSIALVLLTAGCGDDPETSSETGGRRSKSSADRSKSKPEELSKDKPSWPTPIDESVPEDMRTLVAELNDGTMWERADAAKALGKLEPPAVEAVPALSRAVDDEASTVRVWAAWALAKIDPETAKRAAPQMIRDLGDANVAVRIRAASVLKVVGPPPESIAPLGEMLNEDAGQARGEAISTLAKAGRGAIGPLVAGLDSKHEHMPVLVCQALLEIGPAAVPALVTAVGHANVEVRRGATSALVQMESVDPSAIPRLRKAMYDGDLNVRRFAVRALAKTGPAAIPALVDALKSEHEEVRVIAPAVLGQIGEPAIGAMIQALDIEDPDVRTALIRALTTIGEPAIGAMSKALDSEDPDVRFGLIRALSTMGDAGIAALDEALAHADPTVRQVSIAILVGIDSEAVVAILIKALANTNGRVRMQAAGHLGTKGSAATEAVPALADMAVRDAADPLSPNIRSAAQHSAIALDPEGKVAVPLWSKALTDPDEQVRRRAVTALAAYGPNTESAVSALITATSSQSGPVQLAAIYALANMGPAAKRAVPALEELVRIKKQPAAGVAAQALGIINP